MEESALTAVYAYCVLRARRPPSCAHAPRGLAGSARLRAIPSGRDLYLIAADVPLARYGRHPIEARLRDLEWVSRCALAHEAVVEHFAGAGALVPLKLFTIFRTDARAVAHVLREHKGLRRLLDRVDGCEEWSVRVMLGHDRISRAARADARNAGRGKTSGTAFIARKRAERDRVRALTTSARERARDLDATLRRVAKGAWHRGPNGAPGTLLDAAYLLPRAKRRTFRSTAERVARALREDGCTVTLTGPWPPYSFVAG